MRRDQRILCRTLAKELSVEELKIIQGCDTGVAITSESSGDGPPTSTLLATLPDYHEDA